MEGGSGMLCATCHGHHFVIRNNQMQPCPECGGIGEVHCCDGLTTQNDAYALTTSYAPLPEYGGEPAHPVCR